MCGTARETRARVNCSLASSSRGARTEIDAARRPKMRGGRGERDAVGDVGNRRRLRDSGSVIPRLAPLTRARRAKTGRAKAGRRVRRKHDDEFIAETRCARPASGGENGREGETSRRSFHRRTSFVSFYRGEFCSRLLNRYGEFRESTRRSPRLPRYRERGRREKQAKGEKKKRESADCRSVLASVDRPK